MNLNEADKALPLLALAASAVTAPFVHLHADESPVTQCGPGRGHDCHCPRMVQRRRDAIEAACLASSKDKKQLDDCLAKTPTICQMLIIPEYNEDGRMDPDTCYKYCKYQGLCFCHDTRCTPSGDPVNEPMPKMQPLPRQKKGR